MARLIRRIRCFFSLSFSSVFFETLFLPRNKHILKQTNKQTNLSITYLLPVLVYRLSGDVEEVHAEGDYPHPQKQGNRSRRHCNHHEIIRVAH